MQKNTISTWQLLFKNKDNLCFDIQLCLIHLSIKKGILHLTQHF
jgi:hypothetical protein